MKKSTTSTKSARPAKPARSKQTHKGEPEPTMDGREVGDEDANAIAAENEDVPVKPAPKKNLPHPHVNDKDAEGCHCYDSSFPKGKLPPPPILKKLDVEDKPIKKSGKDGVDKAMDILDKYYEGVPLRDPNFDHGGED